MPNAARDGNYIPLLTGVSTADNATSVRVKVNPSTGAIQTEGGGGGSVTLVAFRNTALDNTPTAVGSGPVSLYKIHVFNVNTVDSYFQLYNTASGSVTVGTTDPIWTFWVPAGGAVDEDMPTPLPFSTDLTIAATTTITGGTAPDTGLLVNLGYA